MHSSWIATLSFFPSFFLPIIIYSKTLCGLIPPDPILNLFQKPLKLLSLRFDITLPPPPLIVHLLRPRTPLCMTSPPQYPHPSHLHVSLRLRRLYCTGRKWLRLLEGDWPQVQSLPKKKIEVGGFFSRLEEADGKKGRWTLCKRNCLKKSSLIRP